MSELLEGAISYVKKIVNSGVRENETLHQAFRQKSINSFCLFCIICSTPHYFIFSHLGLPILSAIIFFIHTCFVGVIVLNHYFKFLYAKVLVIFVTNFSVLVLSLALGFKSGFHLYIFTAPIFVFWLFDKQKFNFILLTFFIYIGLYLATLLYDYYSAPLYNADFKWIGLTLYDLNAFCNLMLIFLLFYCYFVYHNLLTNDLLDKQAKLEQEVLKRAESETNIKKLFDDLSRSYKNLEQFSFVVSHNMRAPLANIKGFITLYNKEAESPEENNKIVGFMEQAANHLDDILSDLNFILKNKNTALETKEDLVLSEYIPTIIRSLRKEIAACNADFQLEIPEGMRIKSVKSILTSILYNLFQNAIKYRKNWISPIVSVRFSVQDDYNVIKISDNGVGIDLAKYNDRIFKLYSRFHRNTDGKGLGLYLVKTHIELLGGSIQVQSEVNQGTVFVIYLPIN